MDFINIFIFLLISIILSSVIYFLSFCLIKQEKDTEKLMAYECGFNPYGDARNVFDVRFYLVALLFIIFDLESIFIYPWVLTKTCTFSLGFWTMIEFLLELITGYIYIWSVGSLEWT